jgi:uncharacterized membrane protein
MSKKTFISDLSGKEYSVSEKISAKSIRKPVVQLLSRDHPGFDETKCLSLSELNVYRQKFIAEFLAKEIGELSELEKTVLSSLRDGNTLVDKIEDTPVKITIGQKLADRVASFGGSWRFIITFSVVLAVWITANALILANRGFDPYPFILLNLILSCIAALQAPIIMMSQNRQEEKDRERAKKDYMINLKSELEIRMLHEKLDHLIIHQQHELIEIQKVQVEMMNDIMKRLPESAD